MKVDPNQVQDIFDAALAQDTAARAAFVADACGDNTALRDEVLSLLAAHDAPGTFPPLPKIGDFMADPNATTTTGPADPLIGQTLDGRYFITKKLGEGGLSVVYLAEAQRLAQTVVIKVLKPAARANAWLVDKLVEEGKALANINHAGVVGVLDAGELPGGEPFLVLKFVPGKMLRQRMRGLPSRQMKFVEAAEILRQTGSALSAAHKINVVHRDLKPENIIVSYDNGKPKVTLLDFGILRNLDVGTILGNIVGTPPYMSPEQLAGEEVTFASDIYALAVLAYELLTGRVPFMPRRTGPDAPPSPRNFRADLPQAAEDLILQGLALDPAERPEPAQEYGAALAQALETGTTEPWPPRWLIVAGALVLAAVLGLGIWRLLGANGTGQTVALNANSVVTGRPEGTGPATNTGIYTADPGFPTGAAPSGQAYATIGLTMWRTRPPNANDGAGVVREIVDTKEGAQPVKQQVAFESFADKVKPGEMINLSLEYLPEAGLPQEGYAYVVNRELYADGTLGPATLIFPTLLTYGGNNRIGAGRPIVLPGSDRPFRVDRNPSRADHVGETFTVIIAPQPLKLPEGLSQVRMKLPAGLVEQWERESGTRAYRAELRGGAGRARTNREQGFGGRSVTDTAPLTKADPLPQTCLRLAITPGQPALATVTLRFKD